MQAASLTRAPPPSTVPPVDFGHCQDALPESTSGVDEDHEPR